MPLTNESLPARCVLWNSEEEAFGEDVLNPSLSSHLCDLRQTASNSSRQTLASSTDLAELLRGLNEIMCGDWGIE
jgi:hypothetical protein